VTDGVRTSLYLFDSDNVLRLLHYTSSVCNECCLFFVFMDEKLIELVCKCQELYDMSSKKYGAVSGKKNCREK